MATFKKEISKTISIGYSIDGDKIIFLNSSAVKYIWGAETSLTDMHRILHKDDKGRYYITRETLIKRLEMLRNKRQRLNEAIKVLEGMEL